MITNRTGKHEPSIAVTAGAYLAGDVVGGLLDMSNLCGAGGGGCIRALLLTDDAAQNVALDIYFFDGKPTEVANNEVFATAMTISDLGKLVGKVSIAALDYVTLNGNGYVLKSGLEIWHGSGELWAYIVTNGSTPTYAATTDIALKVIGNED